MLPSFSRPLHADSACWVVVLHHPTEGIRSLIINPFLDGRLQPVATSARRRCSETGGRLWRGSEVDHQNVSGVEQILDRAMAGAA